MDGHQLSDYESDNGTTIDVKMHKNNSSSLTGKVFVEENKSIDGDYEVGQFNMIIPDQRGQEEGNWNEKRGKNKKISRSKVDLEKFSGLEAESVVDFINDFKRVSLINDWDYRAQTLLIPSYLGGRAKDVYMSLEKGIKEDISDVLGELLRIFNSSARKYITKKRANERKQLV